MGFGEVVLPRGVGGFGEMDLQSCLTPELDSSENQGAAVVRLHLDIL